MTAADSSALTMQVCDACAQVQYPEREVCRRCLSDALTMQDVPSTGVVLADALVHVGLQALTEAPLPLHLATVQLGCGAHMITAANDKLKRGDAVTVMRCDGRMWAALAKDTREDEA